MMKFRMKMMRIDKIVTQSDDDFNAGKRNMDTEWKVPMVRLRPQRVVKWLQHRQRRRRQRYESSRLVIFLSKWMKNLKIEFLSRVSAFFPVTTTRPCRRFPRRPRLHRRLLPAGVRLRHLPHT